MRPNVKCECSIFMAFMFSQGFKYIPQTLQQQTLFPSFFKSECLSACVYVCVSKVLYVSEQETVYIYVLYTHLYIQVKRRVYVHGREFWDCSLARPLLLMAFESTQRAQDEALYPGWSEKDGRLAVRELTLIKQKQNKNKNHLWTIGHN